MSRGAASAAPQRVIRPAGPTLARSRLRPDEAVDTWIGRLPTLASRSLTMIASMTTAAWTRSSGRPPGLHLSSARSVITETVSLDTLAS